MNVSENSTFFHFAHFSMSKRANSSLLCSFLMSEKEQLAFLAAKHQPRVSGPAAREGSWRHTSPPWFLFQKIWQGTAQLLSVWQRTSGPLLGHQAVQVDPGREMLPYADRSQASPLGSAQTVRCLVRQTAMTAVIHCRVHLMNRAGAWPLQRGCRRSLQTSTACSGCNSLFRHLSHQLQGTCRSTVNKPTEPAATPKCRPPSSKVTPFSVWKQEGCWNLWYLSTCVVPSSTNFTTWPMQGSLPRGAWSQHALPGLV